MPIVNDLLNRAVQLTVVPATAGVLVTALLLVVSRDWRLNVLALAAQYLFVTLLMTRIVRVEMAAVKGLIGWVICLVFYLTEQQAHSLTVAEGSDEHRPLSLHSWFEARLVGWRREGISAQAAFSFMAAALVTVTASVGAVNMPLPEMPGSLTLVCYYVAGLGMLLLGVSHDPLRVGVGLLMCLSGFDLFYVALEPSLVVTGLIGAIMFVVALGMAYLESTEMMTDREHVQ